MRGFEPPTPGTTIKARNQAFEPIFPVFSRIIASSFVAAIHLIRSHSFPKNRGIVHEPRRKTVITVLASQ